MHHILIYIYIIITNNTNMNQIKTTRTIVQRQPTPIPNTNRRRRTRQRRINTINGLKVVSNTVSRPSRGFRLSSRPNPYLYPNNNNRRRRFRLRLPPRIRRQRAMQRNEINHGAIAGPNKDYIMCRIAPFLANGGHSALPDGSMTRKLMLDHRMQIPFEIGSTGAINIAVTPNLPCPIWFQSPSTDTTYKVNNMTFPHWTSSSYNCVMLPEYQHLKVALRDAAGSFDDAQTLMDASRARIVTAGWSLTYTGTFNNNSGSLRVNTFQASVVNPVPNVAPFHVFNNQTGNHKTWSPNQLMVRVFNYNLPFNGNTSQETRTFALREGAHGLLRHNATEYEWQNLQSTINFITQPANDNHSLLNHSNIGDEDTLQHWPVTMAFDNNWSTTLLSINGATPGSSFLLDIVYCVEYTPNMSDVSYALAKPAPPRNDKAIQTADRIANSQPIATSGNASSTNISEYIKTGASIVSAVAPLIV